VTSERKATGDAENKATSDYQSKPRIFFL